MRSERRNISKKQRISLYSSHDSRRCFNHNIEFGSKLSANKSQCSAVAFGNSVILHSVTKNVIAYTYKMHCCVCNFRQFGRNTFLGCKINGKIGILCRRGEHFVCKQSRHTVKKYAASANRCGKSGGISAAFDGLKAPTGSRFKVARNALFVFRIGRFHRCPIVRRAGAARRKHPCNALSRHAFSAFASADYEYFHFHSRVFKRS